ncbi:MAG: inorganic phosphate transporter, partial [Sulfuricurvum sp.]|uniref:inorganic phosphate transporter n=1 Tax=Sulfuricurvum sp. TaxID=2025608 RepID=UPI0035623822
FGIALVAGLWFIGKEVIQTVGSRITEIFPVTGFSAELGATFIILLATKLGIPVSSTHILVGAIIGIGMLNRNAHWALMRPIAMAWIITLPAAGIMSAIFFALLKITFGY